MPGVPRATISRSTEGSRGLFLECTCKNRESFLEVGQGDNDLAVKSTWSQQCRVQHVGSVRRSNRHDAFGRIESVHLVQHLVQRLLSLIVSATEPRAALATNRVDLVDEDNGRRFLSRSGEEVSNPAGANAHEHFHEVRARNGEERHAGLSRDGARQHRLASARGADQENALGDKCADVFVSSRGLQELDDLTDLLLHTHVTRDVRESRLRPVLIELFGLGSTDDIIPFIWPRAWRVR